MLIDTAFAGYFTLIFAAAYGYARAIDTRYNADADGHTAYRHAYRCCLR